MAFYPDGTVFEFPMSFGPNDTFGDGCVFPAGTTFINPCYLGEGCVGEQVAFITTPQTAVLPPSVTGTGNIWGCFSSFQKVIIGDANAICTPVIFSPDGIGQDCIIGATNNKAEGDAVHYEGCRGGEVSGLQGIEQEYDDCGKICGDGVVAGPATVKDPSRCID